MKKCAGNWIIGRLTRGYVSATFLEDFIGRWIVRGERSRDFRSVLAELTLLTRLRKELKRIRCKICKRNRDLHRLGNNDDREDRMLDLYVCISSNLKYDEIVYTIILYVIVLL